MTMKCIPIVLLLVTMAMLLLCADGKRPSTNCGLKCFRWKKCMGQLSGSDSRPGQLGNTGQIVLTTCDSGDCNCAEEEQKKLEEKRNKDKDKLKANQTIRDGNSSSPTTRGHIRHKSVANKENYYRRPTRTRSPSKKHSTKVAKINRHRQLASRTRHVEAETVEAKSSDAEEEEGFARFPRRRLRLLRYY